MAKKNLSIKTKLDVWEMIFDLDVESGACDVKCSRDATKEDDQKSVKDGKVIKEFKKVTLEILADKGNASPFMVALPAIIKSMGYMTPEEVDAQTEKAIEKFLEKIEEEEEDTQEEEVIQMEVEPEDIDDDYEEGDFDAIDDIFNDTEQIGRVKYHFG